MFFLLFGLGPKSLALAWQALVLTPSREVSRCRNVEISNIKKLTAGVKVSETFDTWTLKILRTAVHADSNIFVLKK